MKYLKRKPLKNPFKSLRGHAMDCVPNPFFQKEDKINTRFLTPEAIECGWLEVSKGKIIYLQVLDNCLYSEVHVTEICEF